MRNFLLPWAWAAKQMKDVGKAKAKLIGEEAVAARRILEKFCRSAEGIPHFTEWPDEFTAPFYAGVGQRRRHGDRYKLYRLIVLSLHVQPSRACEEFILTYTMGQGFRVGRLGGSHLNDAQRMTRFLASRDFEDKYPYWDTVLGIFMNGHTPSIKDTRAPGHNWWNLAKYREEYNKSHYERTKSSRDYFEWLWRTAKRSPELRLQITKAHRTLGLS